jgi:integrase
MFGKRPISSIGYEDVTILRTKLREREIRTANNVEVALRAVLRFSKANKRLASFPELPALRKGPDRLLTLPNVEDVHLALGAAYAEARLALALAAFAGLRAGEILGLRFADVDLAARQLTVRQAIFRGVEGPPKSGSGRKIPIAESLREVLVVAFQRPHEPGDRVCVSTRGEPWASDGSLRSAFAAVLKKVDLPPARVHDLRHFFVTQCFRSGASAPDIQAFVGHRDLRVTQGYAHTDEDSQNDAMQKFEARLLSGRASRGNSVETAPHEAGSAAEASDEKANKSSGEERVCH